MSSSDISLVALKNILPRVIMPDLETPFSRFPNTAVDPIEQSFIHAIIAEHEQQLNTVSEIISGLEKLRRCVVKQQDKIVQSLVLHRGRTSALWRLPDELLSKIFVHPDLLIRSGFLSYPSPKTAPILLTRVCRRWREIVLDMPSVWCKLRCGKIWREVSCYRLWLGRARGRPISLKIDCERDDPTIIHSIRPFQPFSNQILSAYINFSHAESPALIFEDLTSVQKLTLKHTDDYLREFDKQPFVRSISHLPSSLRTLMFVGWRAFDVELVSSYIPVWAHLTYVGLELLNPNALLHLLKHAPNLTSLRVHVGYRPETIPTELCEPFTRADLQCLRIMAYNPLQLRCILDALTLPDLRVLEVHYTLFKSHLWLDKEFKALFARSKFSLKSLVLGPSVMITDEARAEYAILFPCLQIKTCTRNEGRTYRLPHLFDDDDDDDDDDVY